MDPKSRKGVTLDATKGLFEWNVMSLKSPKKIYLTKSKENELFAGWSLEELRQAQEDDADIAPIITWLETSGERPAWVTVSPCSPATKTYWSQWKRLYIRDGVLVRRFYCLDDTQFYPQVVLPRTFRPDIMRQMHEGQVGGHFGVERTVVRLQTRYLVQNEGGRRPVV